MEFGTYVDHETEGDKPADGDEDIDGPVDEAAGEGEKPDDRQEDSDGSDDFGVDESSLAPAVRALDGVQVGTVDSGHDGSEDQLGHAENDAEQICHNHHCGSLFKGLPLAFVGLYVVGWRS